MQRFQSVKHTAVRFATVLLIASLAFFTGCNSEGSNEGSPGFSQNQGVGVPPGTATMLDITGFPANVVANQPFNVTVRVENAGGTLVTDEPTRVTLTLVDITPRGMLFGQTTMDTVDGIATFTVAINAADMFNIIASAPGLMSDTSGKITVAPGDPALVFAENVSTSADIFSPMLGPVIALVTDASSNPVAYNGPANVTLINGPVGAMLTNATVNVMNGIADFSALGFTTPGTYELQVQIPGFPAATFNFTVTVEGDVCYIILNNRLQNIADDEETSDVVEVANPRPNDIGNGTYQGLAISPGGVFYTVDVAADRLVQIDPFTGIGTFVGAGTLGSAGTLTDIAWAGPNRIVALETQGTTPFVYTINTNTGAIVDGPTSLQQLDNMMVLQPVTDRVNNAITVASGTRFVALNPPMQLPAVDSSFGTLTTGMVPETFTLLGNTENATVHLARDPSNDPNAPGLLGVQVMNAISSLAQIDIESGASTSLGAFTGNPTGLDCLSRD